MLSVELTDGSSFAFQIPAAMAAWPPEVYVAFGVETEGKRLDIACSHEPMSVTEQRCCSLAHIDGDKGATYREPAPVAHARLRHVRLKLQRAGEHFEALETTLRTFHSPSPYVVGTRVDISTRRPVYYVARVPPIPETAALTAGDVVHNLVGTLDHLAYQLVGTDTDDRIPKPAKVYFPIAENRSQYDERKRSCLEGALPATVAAIDALQPYKGGNDALWMLNRLNNIAKHRMLLTVGAQAAGISLGPLMASTFGLTPPWADEADWLGLADKVRQLPALLIPADKGFPLTAGFELFIDGPDRPVLPDMRFRFTVVMSEPSVCDGEDVLVLLGRLKDEVGRVVDALSPRLA